MLVALVAFIFCFELPSILIRPSILLALGTLKEVEDFKHATYDFITVYLVPLLTIRYVLDPTSCSYEVSPMRRKKKSGTEISSYILSFLS